MQAGACSGAAGAANGEAAAEAMAATTAGGGSAAASSSAAAAGQGLLTLTLLFSLSAHGQQTVAGACLDARHMQMASSSLALATGCYSLLATFALGNRLRMWLFVNVQYNLAAKE